MILVLTPVFDVPSFRLMARLLKPKFGTQQDKNAIGPSPVPTIGELWVLCWFMTSQSM
jgi:hypothetical protein